MTNYSISFAGAGRVASALCEEMYRYGNRIINIYTPEGTNGRPLAEKFGAAWSSKPEFGGSAEIIFVAVPDNKLREVLAGISCSDKTLVVHTAGSYGFEVFQHNIKRKGVFYPLQTFSHGRRVDFTSLPVLIEASDKDATETLERLVLMLKCKPYYVEIEKRRLLHLAAVFACNFTNHMLTAGNEIVTKAELPFDLLKPIIIETIDKAFNDGPEKSQTGPAVRNDTSTLKKHLELLSFSPELKEIYSEISKSIILHKKSRNDKF